MHFPDDSSGERPPLALIAGPTASGKSQLAVKLALALQARGDTAVVINADSAQVYGDLAVLSARPTTDEMQGVRHRLFGTWDGATACSAADWAAAARAEIAKAHATGGVPILVGGTGLYLQTLLDGIAPVPPIDPEIRSAVRALPVDAAFAALTAEDPHRAAMLAPADRTRVYRALEVVRSTGQPLHLWQGSRTGGIADQIALSPVLLLPDRSWLYARCDARFRAMVSAGAEVEVRALLARNLDPNLPVMRAIGVREVTDWLTGKTTEDEAVRRGQQATRNYAKRQFTWFRGQAPARWPRLTESDCASLDHFVRLLRN